MSKIILWDWDNTLADTLSAGCMTMNRVRKSLGLPLWTPDELEQNSNGTALQIITRFSPDASLVEAAYKIWVQYCSKDAEGNISPQPFAKEILLFARQKGYKNILLSNKEGEALRKEVKNCGLSDLLDEVVGSGDVCAKKTDSTLSDYIKQKYNPQTLFVIGDRKTDMVMADNYTNAKKILVSQKGTSKEFEGIEIDYLVPSLQEIKNILTKPDGRIYTKQEKER